MRNYGETVKEEIKKAPDLRREREDALKREQARMVEMIKNDTNMNVRLSAMLELLPPVSDIGLTLIGKAIRDNDQTAFATWITHDNEGFRIVAVFNLTDEELLEEAAKNDKSEWVRKEAAEQLNKLKGQK